MSAKPEMKLIVAIVPWKNSFNLKYLKNSERYDDRKPLMGYRLA